MNREYLIKCRKAKGYNQAELAKVLGITDSVVSH
jgi:transcriptional regulator with XRE-family HTH domain